MISRSNTFYQPYIKSSELFNHDDKENYNFTNFNNPPESFICRDDYKSNIAKKNSFALNENGSKVLNQYKTSQPQETLKKPLGIMNNPVKVECKSFLETINKRHLGCLINCDSFQNRGEADNMQLENCNDNNIKASHLIIESNKILNNENNSRFENNININETYNTDNKIFPSCFNYDEDALNRNMIDNKSLINSFLNAESSISNGFEKGRKSKSLMVIENISVCVSTQDSQLENNYQSQSPLKNTPDAYQPMFSTNYSKIPHDYILDIWETLKSEEELNKANYHSILRQKDINEKMRAILVDWLVEVHCKFKLRSETLFLTVNLIDRFLSYKQVLRTKLQLVGVAALLVACKYEEVLCPDIRDFVYVTDRAYSKEEILQTELDILLTLNFEVTLPSPLRFFEIIALNFNLNQIEFTYGNYLLEFFLVDTKMNKYPASIIALAAAYIVMKMNNYSNYKELYNLFNNSNKLQCVSNSKTLKDCAREMFYLVENAEQLSKLQAVYNKFSKKKFFSVSKNENCFKPTDSAA